ncbi:RES family NAD+ phosphorylase [Thioalkalivibrio thiocyanodenitrificans]|uniref:RES family NAD+ phosphorylase n=1 Tax=Thioalkalivibrio thiocyanodenitrificans TaxID=243063 RepID=UPI00036A8499|nr:RES family NAD+ phosphorylase [Thioalkalivibrio thiocyanodenitrificans]
MWTHIALASEAQPAAGEAWRVVEHQHTFSTRKVVDTQEEQLVLEDLVEQSKPPYPPGTEHLHYLLKTPFRYYPPSPWGSRFRRADDGRGVFYCAPEKRAAMAECAYWRRRFLDASPGTPLPRNPGLLTVFCIAYESDLQLDLTRPPLDADRALWVHPEDYSSTQALADAARQDGIEIIRYESVRDPQRGDNLALLTPAAFSEPRPITEQAWYLYLDATESNLKRSGGAEVVTFYV